MVFRSNSGDKSSANIQSQEEEEEERRKIFFLFFLLLIVMKDTLYGHIMYIVNNTHVPRTLQGVEADTSYQSILYDAKGFSCTAAVAFLHF